MANAKPVYSIDVCFSPDYMDSTEILSWAKTLDIMQDVSVTDRYRNRLDNLSYDLYRTTDLWWIIALINEISDPMNFNNQSLKCPYYRDVINDLTEMQITKAR